MDHQEALRIQAPERYALGELSSSEVEEFEEHFFSCAECAEDLSTGAIFAANARAVFREQSQRPTATSPAVLPQHGPGWWTWLRPAMAMPLAAAVALLCLVGYQNTITIPRLRNTLAETTAPQSAMSFPLKIARGDEPIVVPRNGQWFTLNFYLPQEAAFSEYEGEIDSAGGSQLRTFALSRPAAGQPFTVLLRRSDFASGPYVIKVYSAGKKAEVATYHFDLKVD